MWLMIARMDREKKPLVRWKTISLRGLLLLIVAIALWLGWIASKARQQREAVAALQKFGGFVHYDWEFVERAGEGSARESALEADVGHANAGQKAVGAGLAQAGSRGRVFSIHCSREPLC